jgi:DNA repair exonuclease SbcCD ATPase subunit
MPFVTAKVDTRAAIPKNIDEAVSHAGAETAFDQFDTALDSLKETYADQINAENKANTDRHNENQRLGIPSIKPEAVTIYDVLGRMTQSEREAAIDKAIDESKLKPERLGNKKARDSFVKSLSEAQQKAVDAKRKEILKAEIKAVSKLGKKSVSDIREARKKATAGTTVATAKVGKAQPVTTRKVEEKKESENIIERETVAALRSGNTDTILRAIKTGYTDPATKLFATRIEATLGQFGMKPTVVVGKVTDNRPAMYDPRLKRSRLTLPRRVTYRLILLYCTSTLTSSLTVRWTTHRA